MILTVSSYLGTAMFMGQIYIDIYIYEWTLEIKQFDCDFNYQDILSLYSGA